MGRQQHNRYNYHFTTPTPTRVTITRRHHPVRGQAFEVLRGGRRTLVVRGTEGMVMRLPRSWTDADGAIPDHDGEGSVFDVEALRELTELVDALIRRSMPEQL